MNKRRRFKAKARRARARKGREARGWKAVWVDTFHHEHKRPWAGHVVGDLEEDGDA